MTAALSGSRTNHTKAMAGRREPGLTTKSVRSKVQPATVHSLTTASRVSSETVDSSTHL